MDTTKFTIKVKSPKIPRKLKKKLKKEGKYKRITTIFKNCSISSITWTWMDNSSQENKICNSF